jgi:hypothetical protein
LTDTLKPFSVGWDVDAEIITLKTNEQYTRTGGELGINPVPSVKEAFPSSHKLLLNGEFITCEAYTIDGLNYFKLRDIGEKIDFSILWDEASNYITIDTSQGYGQELAETAAPDPAEVPTPTALPDPVDPTELPDFEPTPGVQVISPEPEPEEIILPPDRIRISGVDIDPFDEYLYFYEKVLSEEDLRNLALFPALVDLTLDSCEIESIAPLAELTKLDSLTLSGLKITDISPLAGLRNLSQLYLTDNEIEEVNLTGFDNLMLLLLSGNKITKVSLSGMPNLFGLDVSDNQIQEISVAGLNSLLMLDLSLNPITDVSALVDAVNLTWLALSTTDVNSIRKLTQLIDLCFVNATLDENQLKELETALPNCSIEFENW